MHVGDRLTIDLWSQLINYGDFKVKVRIKLCCDRRLVGPVRFGVKHASEAHFKTAVGPRQRNYIYGL
jgi:hypothetical protein